MTDLLCDFRRTHSTQHTLLRLIQSRKKLDNSGLVRTILTELSKTYDSLPHDLLIWKLEAYYYLSFRKQRTKIGFSYSDWVKVIKDITQGSIIRLLFNILINDFSYLVKNFDICNFADDNIVLFWRWSLSSFEKSRAWYENSFKMIQLKVT